MVIKLLIEQMEIGDGLNGEDLRSELSQIAFDLDIGEYTQPIQLGDAVFILYAENIRKKKFSQYQKLEK